MADNREHIRKPDLLHLLSPGLLAARVRQVASWGTEMADNREFIGMVFPYMMDPGEISERAIEKALQRHANALRGLKLMRVDGLSCDDKAGEDFVTKHRARRGAHFVVVTQPDRLASFVMTRRVYEKEYSLNPLRLTAESLELIKEVPAPRLREPQYMKLDLDRTLLR